MKLYGRSIQWNRVYCWAMYFNYFCSSNNNNITLIVDLGARNVFQTENREKLERVVLVDSFNSFNRAKRYEKSKVFVTETSSENKLERCLKMAFHSTSNFAAQNDSSESVRSLRLAVVALISFIDLFREVLNARKFFTFSDEINSSGRLKCFLVAKLIPDLSECVLTSLESQVAASLSSIKCFLITLGCENWELKQRQCLEFFLRLPIHSKVFKDLAAQKHSPFIL